MQRDTAGLRDIVMRLLDVAGLRSGHIELRRAPADLSDLVCETAGGRDGILVDATGPVVVDGDRDRLCEVLTELLDNAVTWAAAATTVGVRLSAEAGAAIVDVTNVGDGIAADERERLFELFFRGEAARHRGVPGNGLGLAVARAIIGQHGGTLTVSEAGATTTTFTVRLPLAA
ncbi:sensor histidine kinase [Actinoplanes sp. NPDC020271]|uniref:sensor histidine kinase n=1 Tax=Actinoplanes sp. NPDC020271 TaxID=3363896 RepID=UPI00378BBE52